MALIKPPDPSPWDLGAHARTGLGTSVDLAFSFLTTRANPSIVADRIASHLPIEMSQKQELLEILNPAERLEKLLPHLSSQMFAVGDEVKVLGGAFVDFEGTIKEALQTEGKVRVAISIFGRSESIELDFSQIKPVTPK